MNFVISSILLANFRYFFEVIISLSKDRFSKAVKEYNENFGEFEEFNIDDIQRDIDNEFNASNAKLEEQSDTLDLDEIENTSNFEELWGKE